MEQGQGCRLERRRVHGAATRVVSFRAHSVVDQDTTGFRPIQDALRYHQFVTHTALDHMCPTSLLLMSNASRVFFDLLVRQLIDFDFGCFEQRAEKGLPTTFCLICYNCPLIPSISALDCGDALSSPHPWLICSHFTPSCKTRLRIRFLPSGYYYMGSLSDLRWMSSSWCAERQTVQFI